MKIHENKKEKLAATFSELAESSQKIHIACPYFNNSGILNKIIKPNDTKIIVTLAISTSSRAIRDAQRMGASVRFLPQGFHTKLYIFDDKVALVGSANFTRAGLQTNQEMLIEVDSPDEMSILNNSFDSYWNQAHEITKNILAFKDEQDFILKTKAQDLNREIKNYNNQIQFLVQKTNTEELIKEDFITHLLSNLEHNQKLHEKMKNNKDDKKGIEHAKDIKANFTTQELNWEGQEWQYIKLYCDFSSTQKIQLGLGMQDKGNSNQNEYINCHNYIKEYFGAALKPYTPQWNSKGEYHNILFELDSEGMTQTSAQEAAKKLEAIYRIISKQA